MIQLNLLTGSVRSGGRRIPLTQGQFAIVDDEDFDRLYLRSWYAKWCSGTKSYYAVRQVPHKTKRSRQTTLRMHRVVVGLEIGDPNHVDHVNHDTLDNRKENLHIVNPRANAENQRNQSKYGSGIRKRRGRFEVHAKINGRQQHLGLYPTLEQAQIARKTHLKRISATPKRVKSKR